MLEPTMMIHAAGRQVQFVANLVNYLEDVVPVVPPQTAYIRRLDHDGRTNPDA